LPRCSLSRRGGIVCCFAVPIFLIGSGFQIE
jgi:hypothetical protein